MAKRYEKRKTVFSSFSGAISLDCQRNIMLLTSQIISTILFGPNTDDEATESQACPTISQLSILFNSKKKGKSLKGAPLYIASAAKVKARNNASYKRISQVENNLALSVCEQFK